jgi:hypothetical protein
MRGACGQPLESTPDALQQLPMPLYLEFALSFILARAAIDQPFAHRRLNAFENTITTLASKWRPRLPLSPAREIRMCGQTREALLAWIEAEEAGQGHTLNRLAVYAAAVTDDSVPEGWVRLDLRSAH